MLLIFSYAAINAKKNVLMFLLMMVYFIINSSFESALYHLLFKTSTLLYPIVEFRFQNQTHLYWIWIFCGYWESLNMDKCSSCLCHLPLPSVYQNWNRCWYWKKSIFISWFLNHGSFFSLPTYTEEYYVLGCFSALTHLNSAEARMTTKSNLVSSWENSLKYKK